MKFATQRDLLYSTELIRMPAGLGRTGVLSQSTSCLIATAVAPAQTLFTRKREHAIDNYRGDKLCEWRTWKLGILLVAELWCLGDPLGSLVWARTTGRDS